MRVVEGFALVLMGGSGARRELQRVPPTLGYLAVRRGGSGWERPKGLVGKSHWICSRPRWKQSTSQGIANAEMLSRYISQIPPIDWQSSTARLIEAIYVLHFGRTVV